ncbi:hypothetical protein BMS3Bbin04_01964 [bacterium BMS3Bbin04]|nr:hypothetical protein BMS3Bbin04_01964 [bacterium BMS3Bbin04]
MKQDELAQLEQEAFRAYNSDGAVELMLGVGFLLMSLILWDEASTGFVGTIPVFIILGIRAYKRKITHPRIGYAKWGEERQRKIRRGKIWLMIILLTMAAFVFLFFALDKAGFIGEQMSDILLPYLFAPIIGLAFCMIAFIRSMPHFYIFGALGFLLTILNRPWHIHLWLILLLLGSPSLVIGIVRLIRFLRNHPNLGVQEV